MSHEGTNWAIKTKGLRPITKIVLWHLADCHNPSAGCFPTQEYLAERCEISRASVNRQLDELEEAGLIRREPQIDPDTKRQRPTRYRLAFEEGFDPQDVVPRVSDMDTASVSQNEPTRVSENDKAVSHSSETLRGTSKGTGKGNQEKNARERDDPTEGLALVGGKVRVHFDDPVFQEIARIRGKSPPTNRDGFWQFSPDMVARAQANLNARASPQAMVAA